MRPSVRSILALALTSLAAPLAAAPQVYADPAGTCNGLTPCYSDLASAVANAGPAPASIGLFPGTYPQSIDLQQMGSAILSSPGTLTLQALDAAGQPAASGATIDPPSGLGLTTGMGTPWPGDLTLRGLAVTSPDSTAMGLIVSGNLLIEDVVAEVSPQIGAVAIADGDLTIERTRVQINGAGGLIAAASGQVTLRDVVADQNGGTGIATQAELGLLLDSVTATANGDGFEAASCNALDVVDTTIDGNTLTGGTLLAGTPECEFVGVMNHPAVAALQVDLGRSAGGGATRGVDTPSISVTNLVSQNNGDYGLGAFAPDAPATLIDTFAYDNVGVGIGIQAGTLVLDGLEALGNRTGIFAQADTVDALRIVTNASLPMPANPPVEGSGFVLAASSAVLDDIQADNNPEIGLLIFQPAPGIAVDIDLVDSQFDGNRIGVAADADVPLVFNADTLFIDNQTTAGMIVSNIGQSAMARIEANDNALGLVLDVTGTMRVERSQFVGNGTGVALSVDPLAQAAVVCSDFVVNTTGLELGQGNAADASHNFWGIATGPTHPGNPGGSGDTVLDGTTGASGIVTYTPFLTNPATDADCPAGVPEAVAVPSLGAKGQAGLLLLVMLIGMIALRVRMN